MNQSQNLSVVYSSDDRYAPFLGISMQSLLKSNTGFEKIEIYVLDCGIEKENQEKLKEIAARWERQITFCPAKDVVEALPLNIGVHKLAIASYARLFLAEILPASCEKVLYLDCDTLILDSLEGLWNTPMDRAFIAGAEDTVDAYFHKIIGLSPELPYVNAGILLVNLKAWRETDLLKHFLKVIDRFGGNVPHHDQGTINAACGKYRVRLPLRYNVTSNLYSFSARTISRIYFLKDYYSEKEAREAIAHPAIVHFTTGLVGRPWEENCSHPKAKAFWDTVKDTPWSDLKPAKDSRKAGLRAFTFVYEHMPLGLFETLYRAFSWTLHLRK